jgi:hypothetical protein
MIAANNGPIVVKNPCQFQGRALSPDDYATSGQQSKNSTTNLVLDIAMGFPAGHYLDPQPLASGNVFQRQAYGNYTFGVYMAAGGVSLSTSTPQTRLDDLRQRVTKNRDREAKDIKPNNEDAIIATVLDLADDVAKLKRRVKNIEARSAPPRVRRESHL